jgi:L-rhamnose isomerase
MHRKHSQALLEPSDQLQRLEAAGDFTGRLFLMEEAKSLPFGAVWEKFCSQQEVPTGLDVLEAIRKYETEELAKRF